MKGRLPGRGDPESGSATVWVLALMAIVWFTTVTVILVADVRAVRHQARTAADMAALAAAERAGFGQAVACDAAGRAARANGARLSTCLVRAGIADVTVEVPLSLRFGPLPPLDGVIMRARAGPARPGSRDVTPYATNR